LSAESITGITKQFAGARAYSDKLVLTVMANWVEGALESLGRELAFRLDRHSHNEISASAFLKTADGTSAIVGGVPTRLKGKTVARIAPIMDARHVPRWEDESFILMTNPLAQFDLYSDPSATGFVAVARYNDAGRVYRGEIGNMYGVRMLLSTNIGLFFAGTDQGSVSALGFSSGITGAKALVFGPDAFYCIEQEGGGVEVIHHPLGSSGSVSDPANQRGSVAVKVHFGVVAAPAADSRLMLFSHEISLSS
jgi:N4-gp56 family major capsid protein